MRGIRKLVTFDAATLAAASRLQRKGGFTSLSKLINTMVKTMAALAEHPPSAEVEDDDIGTMFDAFAAHERHDWGSVPVRKLNRAKL